MTSAIVINSIQSLIDHRYQLRASCHSCRHHAVLDLNRLGKQLGFDHFDLARRPRAQAEMFQVRELRPQGDRIDAEL